MGCSLIVSIVTFSFEQVRNSLARLQRQRRAVVCTAGPASVRLRWGYGPAANCASQRAIPTLPEDAAVDKHIRKKQSSLLRNATNIVRIVNCFSRASKNVWNDLWHLATTSCIFYNYLILQGTITYLYIFVIDG